MLYVDAGDGPTWAAGIVFAAAAATDQLDGWLARRWHVESAFGKVADPLADRLMIGVAVILLWADGRLPWPAAVLVLGRDLLLVLGYKLVVPRGYEFEVSAARKGRHLDPVLLARVRDRDGEGHRVADRAASGSVWRWRSPRAPSISSRHGARWGARVRSRVRGEPGRQVSS